VHEHYEAWFDLKLIFDHEIVGLSQVTVAMHNLSGNLNSVAYFFIYVIIPIVLSRPCDLDH